MTHHPPRSSLSQAVSQRMLLNKQNVQMGESYAIKGDAQMVQELQDTVQGLAEKKLKQADLEAKRIVEAAKQEARQEAARILNDAKTKAEATAHELVSTAEAQRDSIKESAFQEGFNAGFEAGHQEATGKVEAETVMLLEASHTIINGAYQAEKYILEQFQDDAMALVKHVTQKILKAEIEQKPEHLIQLICGAIDNLYLTGRVRVVLGQEYLEMLRHFTPSTQALMDSLKRFEWTGDPLMTQHEIHILASEGAFSISPEDQINQILEPLAQQLPLAEPPVLEKPSIEELTAKTLLNNRTEEVDTIAALEAMPLIPMPELPIELPETTQVAIQEASVELPNLDDLAELVTLPEETTLPKMDMAYEDAAIEALTPELPQAFELEDLESLMQPESMLPETETAPEPLELDSEPETILKDAEQNSQLEAMELPDFGEFLQEDLNTLVTEESEEGLS